jgi:hypothetical protein
MKSSKFICERPPEGVKLSAPEKGKLNKRNFEAYVNYLKETGRKFPISQFGDVNHSKIAELCGFERQVFSNNKSLKERLDAEVKSIGTDAVEGKDPESRVEIDMKSLRKQLSNVRRDLALAEEKIEGLQRQLIDRDSKLRRSVEQNEEVAESLDYMISTGRRFAL